MSAEQEKIPLVIAHMEDHDAESLNLLFRRVVEALPYYNQTAKQTELRKYSATLLREAAQTDPGSVLVAKIGPELVGFCLSENDDGLIWLAWFGVHPKFRRQGIGAALLDKLEDVARSAQSHKIWCDCRTENETSKVSLRNNGYVELCTVRNHWYGQDFILWEKLVA